MLRSKRPSSGHHYKNCKNQVKCSTIKLVRFTLLLEFMYRLPDGGLRPKLVAVFLNKITKLCLTEN